MSKYSISRTASRLPQNDEIKSYKATPTGESVDGLNIEDILVEPGHEDTIKAKHQSRAREEAVRQLDTIVKETEHRATTPYHTAGSLIRNSADRFADFLYDSIYGDVSPEEENQRKLNEIRRRALLEIDEEIKINPSEALYAKRESLNDDLGNHEEATQDFQNIVKIRAEALEERRVAVKKSYDEGITNSEETLFKLDRIIAIDPELPWVHQDKAGILRAMGRYEEALFHYTEVIKKFKYEEALSQYTEATTGVKSKFVANPEIYEYRANLLRIMGKDEEAARDYRALHKYYDRNDVYKLYKNIAEEENSIFWYDQLLQRHPYSWDGIKGKADIYYSQGDYNQVLNIYDTFIKSYHVPKLYPLISDSYFEKFKVKLQLGQHKEALGDLLLHLQYTADSQKARYFAYGASSFFAFAIALAVIVQLENYNVQIKTKDFFSKVIELREEYRRNNPDQQELKFIIPLLNRLLREDIRQRGGILTVLQDIEPILKIWEEHVNHLAISNQIAGNILQGCINQPVAIFNEIAAFASVQKASGMIEKMEAIKHLLILDKIKEYIAEKFKEKAGVEVELENLLLQKVHQLMLKNANIQTPWLGVPSQIAYVDMVENLLTDEKIQSFYQEIQKDILNQSPFWIAKLLINSAHCDIFGDLAFPDAILASDKKYENEKYLLLEKCDDAKAELAAFKEKHKDQIDDSYQAQIQKREANIESLEEAVENYAATLLQKRRQLIGELIIQQIIQESSLSSRDEVLHIAAENNLDEFLKGFLNIPQETPVADINPETQSIPSPRSSVINPSAKSSQHTEPEHTH